MTHGARKGEPPALRTRRADRCFLANGNWYLTTREAIYVGPFPTKTMAEAAATELTALLVDVSDTNVAEAFVREFRRRATEKPPSRHHA